MNNEEYKRKRIKECGEMNGYPFLPPEITTMLEFHYIVLSLSANEFTDEYDTLDDEADYLIDAAQQFEYEYKKDEMSDEDKFSYLHTLSHIRVVAKGEVH